MWEISINSQLELENKNVLGGDDAHLWSQHKKMISELEANYSLQSEFQDSQGYTENPCL